MTELCVEVSAGKFYEIEPRLETRDKIQVWFFKVIYF
jgi:hypothetical protein